MTTRLTLIADQRIGLLAAYRWVSAVVDPVKLRRVPRGLCRYVGAWRAYRRLPGAERLAIVDSYPCLHDVTTATAFDAHYFYQDVWAATLLTENKPQLHVDVGSHIPFVGMLSAQMRVVFVDIRPLPVHIDRLSSVAADGLHLPFPDFSVPSLSCLHVAEHVGLGRYGDALNPHGTRMLCRELSRVLEPGGRLVFSVPVGRARVCFNAHRVHCATDVGSMFPDLQVESFALVDDNGRYNRDATPADAADSDYACGLFVLSRR